MWGEEIGGGVGSEFTINVMRMTYRVNETFLTLQILLISKSSANPSIKVIHLRPLRCYIGHMIYKYMHLVVKYKQSNKENKRLFLLVSFQTNLLHSDVHFGVITSIFFSISECVFSKQTLCDNNF
jgi:hypothetical protein